MFLVKQLLEFVRPRRAGRFDEASVLMPQGLFQRELERERMRADRSGIPFCLLTYDVVDRHRAPLLNALGQRLRKTDTAGLLSTHRVGVILPETPPAGAETLAEHLAELYDVEGRPPRCQIFVHPTDGRWRNPDGRRVQR